MKKWLNFYQMAFKMIYLLRNFKTLRCPKTVASKYRKNAGETWTQYGTDMLLYDVLIFVGLFCESLCFQTF